MKNNIIYRKKFFEDILIETFWDENAKPDRSILNELNTDKILKHNLLVIDTLINEMKKVKPECYEELIQLAKKELKESTIPVPENIILTEVDASMDYLLNNDKNLHNFSTYMGHLAVLQESLKKPIIGEQNSLNNELLDELTKPDAKKNIGKGIISKINEKLSVDDIKKEDQLALLEAKTIIQDLLLKEKHDDENDMLTMLQIREYL